MLGLSDAGVPPELVAECFDLTEEDVREFVRIAKAFSARVAECAIQRGQHLHLVR